MINFPVLVNSWVAYFWHIQLVRSCWGFDICIDFLQFSSLFSSLGPSFIKCDFCPLIHLSIMLCSLSESLTSKWIDQTDIEVPLKGSGWWHIAGSDVEKYLLFKLLWRQRSQVFYFTWSTVCVLWWFYSHSSVRVQLTKLLRSDT